MKKYSTLAIMILIVLGGFALRLLGLGEQSLWYDETVSAVLAQQSIPALIAHTAGDIHPPGYYLLLHGWTYPAGSSEFSLAFFSLFWGVLLIAAIYRLGRLFTTPSATLWAAGLTAISGFNVWYSQEVRMYTLGALLGVAAVYCLWQGIFSNKPAYWWGYIGSAALGMYTLYYFAFLLLPLNLFVLILLIMGQKKSTLICFFAANVTAALLYLPWLGIAWQQAVNPPVPPWRSNIPWQQIIAESWSVLGLGESVKPGGYLWLVPVTAIMVYVSGLFALRSARLRWLLPLLTFAPLAIIMLIPVFTGSPLYHARYLFTYAPAFYLTLGIGLAYIHSRHKPAAILAAITLIGGNAFSIYHLRTDPAYAADDLRGAVQFIQQQWQPGDVIIVNAGYTYTALRYYFTAPVEVTLRLTDLPATPPQPDPARPLILQTGSVDGPPSLGWGNPHSDFYAMSRADTLAALAETTRRYPRLWVLRAYDTVTDPNGVIRTWLAQNTTPFADQPVAGPSYFRVQGFLSPHLLTPPQAATLSFNNKIQLDGFIPVAGTYRPGESVYTALWLRAAENLAAEPPYAVSLKLWDNQGNLAAQSDSWPAGSLYLSPVWSVGKPVYIPLQLVLPSVLLPGQYWLDVQVYRSDQVEALPVLETGKNGITLGGININW